MFGECSERDVRPAHVPDVDVEVEQQGTARDVKLALWSPADAGHGRNRLDVVRVGHLRWTLQVPHLVAS